MENSLISDTKWTPRSESIFPFFRDVNVFSIENFKFSCKSWMLQQMSHKIKRVSKAGEVKSGDKVTIPVKVACKPEPQISATKWVETFCPNWAFLTFTDFKRRKYSFSSPIPSMQCCADVRATYRKQKNFPTLNGGGRGGGQILLFSELTLFEHNLSTILSHFYPCARVTLAQGKPLSF